MNFFTNHCTKKKLKRACMRGLLCTAEQLLMCAVLQGLYCSRRFALTAQGVPQRRQLHRPQGHPSSACTRAASLHSEFKMLALPFPQYVASNGCHKVQKVCHRVQLMCGR